MAGRVDISSKSSSSSAASRSSNSGSMAPADKIKLGAAVAILIVGGLWIGHYFGAFDSLLQGKPDPNVPIVDGKALPPEEIEEFQKKAREYKEANEKHAAEVGPPAGS